MHRKLTDQMIEATARRLLVGRRRLTLRALTAELRREYGASGRNARVNAILRTVEAQASSVVQAPAVAPSGQPQELEQLRAELGRTRERAERAEERERVHQDFFARQLEERVREIEARYAAALRMRANISPDQHLRLHQRIAELQQRLAEYEGAVGGGDSETSR